MKQKLLAITLIIPIIFIIIGCQQSTEDNTSKTKTPVKVISVTLDQVDQTLVYNGDIKAEFEIKVYSKIVDRITNFYTDEGNFVRKGDIIAVITATTIEQSFMQADAALSAAQAQMANMKSEYERASRLYQEDAISQQQYDGIQTQYEATSAQLKQAEAMKTSAESMFQDTKISAPISGIIGKRFYEIGDMVNPAMPIVTIVQMDQVEITCNVSERDLGRIAKGQEAKVTVISYPDLTFLGQVTKISPVLDPMTRMATVKVMIDNPKHLLKPGMFANVEITVGSIKDVIVVPRYTVLESTSLKSINGNDKVVKNYFVFIIDDSLNARQRQLEVGYVNHRVIAVEKGISVGEKLVIAGQNNLRDGMPVFIPEVKEVK